jgi:[ribosomal protein S5]-alanine N-acetyltransferase
LWVAAGLVLGWSPSMPPEEQRRELTAPSSVVLETSRLALLELRPEDLDFVAEMLGNAEVSRYYERRFSREDASAWIDRQLQRYSRDGHGLWLVRERATGAPVGQVGLALQEVDGARHPEIGWLLHRPFWGRGYATEAGAATLDAAFHRWRYPRVISLIRPENKPSQRVAERVGLAPGRFVEFHGFTHIMFALSRSGEAGA